MPIVDCTIHHSQLPRCSATEDDFFGCCRSAPIPETVKDHGWTAHLLLAIPGPISTFQAIPGSYTTNGSQPIRFQCPLCRGQFTYLL